MYILAIDPGQTVGIATIELHTKSFHNIYTGQIGGSIEELADLQKERFFDQFAVVVCEDYIVRPDTYAANVQSKLLTVRMIGALELICKLNDQEFVLQTAAQAKGAWPDDRLETFAEKYNLTDEQLSTPHKRDALRHLLTYIENNFETIVTNPTVL